MSVSGATHPAENASFVAWPARMRRAARVLWPYVSLAVAPVAIWTFVLIWDWQRNLLAFDFHHVFYPQGSSVLAGRTPATAYPALASLLLAPLSALPIGLADILLTFLLLAAAVATLLVLGVRDWRCYGAAAVWYPVYSAVQTGNLSLLLALGVAVAWRYRERATPAGAAIAAVVALKLFLWPLIIWQAGSRRWRSVAVMFGFGLCASAAAWVVVGFDRLDRFPAALSTNITEVGDRPDTLTALLKQLGAPAVAAYGVTWAIGLVVAALGLGAGRRGEDGRSLALLVGAALLLSPIVWIHYLAVLLVPVAIVSPRFGVLWLLPLPLWVCPPTGGAAWQKALVLVVIAVVIAQVTRMAKRGVESAASEDYGLAKAPVSTSAQAGFGAA